MNNEVTKTQNRKLKQKLIFNRSKPSQWREGLGCSLPQMNTDTLCSVRSTRSGTLLRGHHTRRRSSDRSRAGSAAPPIALIVSGNCVLVDPYSRSADKNELKRAAAKNRQLLRTPALPMCRTSPPVAPTPANFGLVVGFLCCKNGTKFPLMSRWQMTTAMIY